MWSATASLDPARFSGDVAKRGVARVLSRDVASPCRSMELLGAWDDEYDGVVVDPASLPSAANAFASQLQSSLAYWRSKVLNILTYFISCSVFLSQDEKGL